MAKTNPGVATLKKKADKIFSEYIRKRDSDGDGYAECITCGTKKPWKQIQAGHFVSRRVNQLRYNEQNVNAQCYACNVMRYGEQYAYSRALDSKYGTGTAEELHAQRFQSHKFTIGELQAIIDEYR